MRILVSGSREYQHFDVIEEALDSAAQDERDVVVVHGDARGADRLGKEAALMLGFSEESHPADWNSYGNAAGPIRNTEMLSGGIDIALFFLDSKAGNVGTRHALKLAKRLGVPSRYFVDRDEVPYELLRSRLATW